MTRHLFVFIIALCVNIPQACAVEDRRDSDSPYGVLAFLHWNHDWNYYHYPPEDVPNAVRTIKEAGAGFVRFDFLWEDIEPEPDRFDFAKYDAIVNTLDRHDIKVLGILNYNPSWRLSAWNAAPDHDLYVKYVRRVVGHFKDRVKYWEIWNEPDTELYWKPQDDLKSYAALLKESYKAIKEEDPASRVLMGAASQDIPKSMEMLYAEGAGDFFDIVNAHPFVNPLNEEPVKELKLVLESLRDVMIKNGQENKDIWITEIGCPGLGPEDLDKAWWHKGAPTEEVQAGWVKDVYANALEVKGVKKIFWAFFRDTPDHFGNAIDAFGLVREDYSPKPAYKEYQNMIFSKSEQS